MSVGSMPGGPQPGGPLPSGPMPGGPLPLSMREAVVPGVRPERLTSPARLEPLGIVKQEVLGLVKSESLSPRESLPGPAGVQALDARSPVGLLAQDARGPVGMLAPDTRGPVGMLAPRMDADGPVRLADGPAGSVFGGLVSYFSSQHEDDDIDA